MSSKIWLFSFIKEPRGSKAASLPDRGSEADDKEDRSNFLAEVSVSRSGTGEWFEQLKLSGEWCDCEMGDTWQLHTTTLPSLSAYITWLYLDPECSVSPQSVWPVDNGHTVPSHSSDCWQLIRAEQFSKNRRIGRTKTFWWYWRVPVPLLPPGGANNRSQSCSWQKTRVSCALLCYTLPVVSPVHSCGDAGIVFKTNFPTIAVVNILMMFRVQECNDSPDNLSHHSMLGGLSVDHHKTEEINTNITRQLNTPLIIGYQ